ncbi:MAG: hypothetical protein QOD99_1005 [Chthoniobacter sp.]|nr:hypothetical protein [Chthoniobacter sp.]
MLKRLLEMKRPYEVVLEHDSRRALSTTLSFKPDLILLDVIMPELDGGDVAGLIRRTEAVSDVPIVFISAVAQPIEGYPFLSKPASLDQVLACIEDALPS